MADVTDRKELCQHSRRIESHSHASAIRKAALLLDAFKATGKGWQASTQLRQFIIEHPFHR